MKHLRRIVEGQRAIVAFNFNTDAVSSARRIIIRDTRHWAEARRYNDKNKMNKPRKMTGVTVATTS